MQWTERNQNQETSSHIRQWWEKRWLTWLYILTVKVKHLCKECQCCAFVQLCKVWVCVEGWSMQLGFWKKEKMPSLSRCLHLHLSYAFSSALRPIPMSSVGAQGSKTLKWSDNVERFLTKHIRRRREQTHTHTHRGIHTKTQSPHIIKPNTETQKGLDKRGTFPLKLRCYNAAIYHSSKYKYCTLLPVILSIRSLSGDKVLTSRWYEIQQKALHFGDKQKWGNIY